MSEDDVPQPAIEPYSCGDRVRVYIGPDDPDKQYHGDICEILEAITDDLGSETGRRLDAYSYRVRSVESDTELPITFRHRDLVPVANDL